MGVFFGGGGVAFYAVTEGVLLGSFVVSLNNLLSLLWCVHAENPKTEKQDTFVEKLVTQVIKNLQVKISNIHIRYEDVVSIKPVSISLKSKSGIIWRLLTFCLQVTNPNVPLSFGVSLQNLSLQVIHMSRERVLLIVFCRCLTSLISERPTHRLPMRTGNLVCWMKKPSCFSRYHVWVWLNRVLKGRKGIGGGGWSMKRRNWDSWDVLTCQETGKKFLYINRRNKLW